MKNLYKLLIGVLALSTVTSCDDYLEVDHYDILPADFMFKTEENVLSGLNGLYDTFYTDQHGSGDDETWGFKPQVFAANHSAHSWCTQTAFPGYPLPTRRPLWR